MRGGIIPTTHQRTIVFRHGAIANLHVMPTRDHGF
jgi:hypothetical protein